MNQMMGQQAQWFVIIRQTCAAVHQQLRQLRDQLIGGNQAFALVPCNRVKVGVDLLQTCRRIRGRAGWKGGKVERLSNPALIRAG